jgi:hypothetical protein
MDARRRGSQRAGRRRIQEEASPSQEMNVDRILRALAGNDHLGRVLADRGAEYTRAVLGAAAGKVPSVGLVRRLNRRMIEQGVQGSGIRVHPTLGSARQRATVTCRLTASACGEVFSPHRKAQAIRRCVQHAMPALANVRLTASRRRRLHSCRFSVVHLSVRAFIGADRNMSDRKIYRVDVSFTRVRDDFNWYRQVFRSFGTYTTRQNQGRAVSRDRNA